MGSTNVTRVRDTLTPKRQHLYDWIVNFARLHGYFPTLREISEETGISLTNVWHHVNKLKETGLLRDGDRQRCFTVTGMNMHYNPNHPIRVEE
jgi:repressor LexA